MSSTEAPLAVQAVGVCRRYGRRWALANVDLQVTAGSAVVVAGRNGSGKSTLFRVLSSLIRPDRGTVRILGLDPQVDPMGVRARIALLSHHSNHYEALSALENLQIAARFLRTNSERASMMPLLDEVGLADRADDVVSTFSAGMRKRLTLARTLLQRARVVFLDEPYGQLDPPGFRLIDAVVTRLKAGGTTVFLATHQIERGAGLCDQAFVLEAGRVAWSGAASDLPTSGVQATLLSEGGA